MITRFLVWSSIAVFALAACSGGQPPRTNQVAEPELPPEPEPEVVPSLIWAAMKPPTGPLIERPAAVPASAASDGFERIPRAAATDVLGTGTADSERLQVLKTPVLYEDGKSLFVPGVSASTEEFPVNSITIRMGPSGDLEYIQGDDGSEPQYTAGGLTTDLYYSDGVLDYSLQATADGLIYKMRGNAVYFDFQRRFDIGENFISWYSTGPDGIPGTADDGVDGDGIGVDNHPTQPKEGCYTDLADATPDCTNWNFDDVQVTFGLPVAAPNNSPTWYWNVRVPLPDGADNLDRNLVQQFDYTYNSNRQDLGSYEMWLTNVGDIDTKLEDVSGQPYAEDDAPRYLSYAAYGLFVFSDNLGSFQKVARAQALHFGYEAFADSSNARTTDISSPVTATFTGRTMAHRYLHLAGGDQRRGDREELLADITLNATIGGSDGGGITGTISNFRMLGPDGLWHRHFGILDPDADDPERLVLAGTDYKAEAKEVPGDTEAPYIFDDTTDDAYKNFPAEISASGTFKGGVFLQKKLSLSGRWQDKTDTFDTYVTTDTSQFGGRFYGPTDNEMKDLETAGHWFLRADAQCKYYGSGCEAPLQRTGGVYGSYGAFNTRKEFDQ